MSKTGDFCREMGHPKMARDVELMERYGHMTLDEWNEMLDRYHRALEQIRDHYTDTDLAAKHMAAVAGAALGRYVPVSSSIAPPDTPQPEGSENAED